MLWKKLELKKVYKKINLDDDYIIGNTINENGLDNLKDAIIKKLNLEAIKPKDMTYLSNVRQIDLIKKSLASVSSAIKNLEKAMPIDIVEIDINNAWNFLGEVTGEVYQDELIDTLFKNFCVGK